MALTQFEFGTVWSERPDTVRHIRVRGIGQDKTVDLLDWANVTSHLPYHGANVRGFWPKQLELTIQTHTGRSTYSAVHAPFQEGPNQAFFGSFTILLRRDGGLLWIWSAGRGNGEDSVRVVEHPTP
jgi:hypothetical protein